MSRLTAGIVCVLIGALIGFVSAYSMWRVQLGHQKRKIAEGFHIEVCRLEKSLALYAKAFSTGEGLPPGAEPGSLIHMREPLYERGLFFDLKREMLSLDRETVGALFEFYEHLLEVERLRRVDPSDPWFKALNPVLKSSLREAHHLVPRVKNLLEAHFR